MPVKDKYHNTVIRALMKDGWRIIKEQYPLGVEDRHLWIDFSAEKLADNLVVLVEVKGFENIPSQIEYLASAVGKYMLYRVALDLSGNNSLLYMAVPKAAYNGGIMGEEIGKQVARRFGIHLIVFDPVSEEIIQWLN